MGRELNRAFAKRQIGDYTRRLADFNSELRVYVILSDRRERRIPKTSVLITTIREILHYTLRVLCYTLWVLRYASFTLA